METFAVIGNGKTGSYVAQALGNRCVAEFSRSKPIQPENFPLVDAIIAFVPGPAVQSLIPRNSAISSLEHWLQRSKSNVSSETHFLGSVPTSSDSGHWMQRYATDKLQNRLHI